MTEEQEDKIKEIARQAQDIKLLYLFGSRATGKAGPLSDYDFAVYLDGIDKARATDRQIELSQTIGKILKTDKVDVVILNKSRNPILNFRAIADGKLLYEVEPYRAKIEPSLMNSYIDYTFAMRQHGLTRI